MHTSITKGHGRTFGMALLLALTAVAPLARAQQADVIRGRVTSDDGRPVERAGITVTSIPNNVTRTATTDKNGRYTVTVAGGDGDYWIAVSAIGYTARRFELKRLADEQVLLGDIRLARAGALLDSVKIRADRGRPGRNDNATDGSGTEKSVSAANTDVRDAGNLAAMAASLPGVQLIPGADGNPDQFSVFGLSGDQNSSTLNGLAFSGADIPRDATTRTALGTSPWDVARGGFSGGQFSVRTQSGSNFSARGVSALLNTPTLQYTDRAGRATGAPFTSASLGASTGGALVADRVFYNAGYQVDRRVSDLQNLSAASPLALRTAGISADSALRLTNILAQAGVPTSVSGLPSAMTNDRGSLLAAIDLAPPSATSGQSLNITASGNFSRLSSPFGQVTALPTIDAARTNYVVALQARHTTYIGNVLSESSAGVMRSRVTTDPYLSLPVGMVRVASALDDGASAISQLAFGGNPSQRTSNAGTSGGAQNALSWFSEDNRHRLKLTSEFRAESFAQDLTSLRLGAFLFNSLADLEAGRPTVFTRQLAPRLRRGEALIMAASLGDSWRPTRDFQLQYGVRVDGNRYLTAPDANVALAQRFGVDNTFTPDRWYVSPRVGLSWTYGTAPQLAQASGFARGPRAVLRAGVGVFQGTPGAMLIASALTNTGLADATRQLTCVGNAVPVPEWRRYLADPSSIPTTCADGTSGTPFSSSAPPVTLFDRAYTAPRSLRANANWSGATFGNRLSLSVDGTYSRNLAQPGFVDLNFNPAVRFALDGEGARPVYVNAASIVAATGGVASTDARLSPEFAGVAQQRSDLRSVSRQLIVRVQPLSFSSRFSWEAGYVLASTRDLARGFSSTAGDPRTMEWARSPFDSRHQLLFSASYNAFNWFPVTFSGWFRSGRPYTPNVASDINGDGYANDRAFVFDPSASGLDASLASGLGTLLASGSRSARECLTQQIGRLATRNSCETPWSSQSNLTIGLNPVKFRLPQRLNVSLYVSNALGAADLLLHGEDKRKGWGQPVNPEQSLYFVRGFDPVTRRFRYEVNPRFGASGLAETVNRNPVVITAMVRLDVGFARERQLLTRSLDQGRARAGQRASDQDIRGMSRSLIPPNPMQAALQQADSLDLTRQQEDSLTSLNRRYVVTLDSIWTPVVQYLATLPVDYSRRDAYDRYRRAREASVDRLLSLAPVVRTLLTAAQRRRLPAAIVSSLDARYLASVRSSTAGGANMGILGMLAQMNAMGAASVDAGTVMIHR